MRCFLPLVHFKSYLLVENLIHFNLCCLSTTSFATISHRRLRGLPPKTTETHFVELFLDARESYDEILQEAKVSLNLYNTDNNNETLERLTSLTLYIRKICIAFALLVLNFRFEGIFAFHTRYKLVMHLLMLYSRNYCSNELT